MTRNYRVEYDNYQGTPEQKRKRAERNKARRMLTKEGAVRKGDGKDVDHKTPLAKGGATTRGNLKAVAKGTNRSFARTRSAGMK
jgi:hypothetical protein